MVLNYVKKNFCKIYFQLILIIGLTLMYSFIMIRYFDSFNFPIFILLLVVTDIIVYKISLKLIDKWVDKTSDEIMERQYEDILNIILESEDEIFLNKVKTI